MTGAIVQRVAGTDNSSGTTISATITGVTAGNHLVVHVGWGDPVPPGTITCSVSDGTSYTAADSKRTDTNNSQSGQVFYLENAGSGSHTVTATFSSSSLFRAIRIYEVSGLLTSGSLDANFGQFQSSPGTGTGGVSSGATSATTNANDFVMGFTQNTGEGTPGTSTLTAGTGYTLGPSSDSYLGYEYKSVSATGAQTATFTQSVNVSRVSHVVAFKEAAGAPTINTQPEQQTSTVGGTATFSVSATTSGGALSYQWRKFVSGAMTNIGGATSASYVTGTLASSDNGTLLDCVVTDSNGSVTTLQVWLFLTGLPLTGKGTKDAINAWMRH